MSEPVSAFAAYKASGVIKPKKNKKTNLNKNNNNGKGSPKKGTGANNKTHSAKNKNKNQSNLTNLNDKQKEEMHVNGNISQKINTNKPKVNGVNKPAQKLEINTPNPIVNAQGTEKVKNNKKNGNKNAKSSSQISNNAKTSNSPQAKSNIQQNDKNKKNAAKKDQKTISERKDSSNSQNRNDDELDVFTATELQLLAAKPSSLSKEDQIRRAEIESKYLRYIEANDNSDNDEGAALSEEEVEVVDASLNEDEFENSDDESIGEEEYDEGEECEEVEEGEEEEEGDEDENDIADESDSDNEYTEYTLNSYSDSSSIEEHVLDDLVLDGDKYEYHSNSTPMVSKISAQKRKIDEAATTPAKQVKTSAISNRDASPSERFNDVVKSVVSNVKLEPLSPPSIAVKSNSIEDGKKAFNWLINPMKIEDFFSKYWEQGACLIKRTQADYFKNLISFEKIGKMLLDNNVEFTKNIDITRYKNGKRETLNPEGRALPATVWDFYKNGCSVRLLNPQTFIASIYSLCARMQEFFSSFVGVNAYLTPAGTQGFAPHYDDIEAFVVQIEGEKRWRLYKPRQPSEYLPRFSSENFKQSEIGDPIFEQVLKPGDVLYFPRGTIHQAVAEKDHHSLHLTFSVYQKNSYADLFEKLVPLVLNKTINTCLDIRKGLPMNIWRNAGIAFSETESEERATIVENISKMVKKMLGAIPMEPLIDQAVDQLAKKFQHEALPPEILPSEKNRTIFGSSNSKNAKGAWVPDYDINLRTNVRLLRANILRLVEEEDKLRIYYHLDNTKEYCEQEPNFIEIARKEAGCVEVLIRSYPEYVGVSQLPLKSADRKVAVVKALWERGLLIMEKPYK